MSDGFRIISRWFLDACVSEALASFRRGDYALFSDIARQLESLVMLPMDGRGDTVLKLRCMQFLSRINNGERLDLCVQEPLLPLESALQVLECLCREMEVPEREQQRVHSAITEMLIIVCIRSGEFDKAEEVLHKHFSTTADSAGKRKLLVNLIRRRRSCHSVLQISSYSDFKQDMLEFIERLYRVPEPFLLQMLKRSGHLRVRSDPPTSSSSQEQQSSPQQPSAAAEDHGSAVCVSLCGLQQAYGQLREECGVCVPFSELLQEERASREPSGDELHLLLSETPVEPPEPRYAGMTVSRLVMEDDSQPSDAEPHTHEPHTHSDPQPEHSGSAAQRSTHSTPPSLTHRISVSSDEEQTPSDRHRAGEEHSSSEAECVLEVRSATQSSTPARHSRGDHRARVSSESEVHSTCSHTHTRSAPADSGSSGGTRHAKRGRWQDVSGTHEDWSEEESLFRAASGPSRKKKYTRKLWTVQESDWLKEGVQRFGVGRWEKIRANFPFTGRTACNLKDRWRTMTNLKMV